MACEATVVVGRASMAKVHKGVSHNLGQLEMLHWKETALKLCGSMSQLKLSTP